MRSAAGRSRALKMKPEDVAAHDWPALVTRLAPQLGEPPPACDRGGRGHSLPASCNNSRKVNSFDEDYAYLSPRRPAIGEQRAERFHRAFHYTVK